MFEVILHENIAELSVSCNVRNVRICVTQVCLTQMDGSLRKQAAVCLTGLLLWEVVALTLPSTPTPQSASWIMLTSFPPSPEKEKTARDEPETAGAVTQIETL